MVGDPGIDELVADLSASIGLLVRRLRQRKADGELTMPSPPACPARPGGPGDQQRAGQAGADQPPVHGCHPGGAGGAGTGGAAARSRGWAQGGHVADGAGAAGAGAAAGRRHRRHGPGAGDRLHGCRDRAAARRCTLCSNDWPSAPDGGRDDGGGGPVGEGRRPLPLGRLGQHHAAVFMATLDGSIVIIALPAIFRGIHLDPLAPATSSISSG